LDHSTPVAAAWTHTEQPVAADYSPPAQASPVAAAEVPRADTLQLEDSSAVAQAAEVARADTVQLDDDSDAVVPIAIAEAEEPAVDHAAGGAINSAEHDDFDDFLNERLAK
jgi:hypothetical protein